VKKIRGSGIKWRVLERSDESGDFR
jgi:hypothetical protein